MLRAKNFIVNLPSIRIKIEECERRVINNPIKFKTELLLLQLFKKNGLVTVEINIVISIKIACYVMA